MPEIYALQKRYLSRRGCLHKVQEGSVLSVLTSVSSYLYGWCNVCENKAAGLV